MKTALVLLSLVAPLGCSVSTSSRLNNQPSGNLQAQVRDSNPNDLGRSEPTTELGEVRLLPEACSGMDLAVEQNTIGAQSLLDHLQARGYRFTIERARTDLIYVDIADQSGPTRLRVATLPSAPEAGRHLHQAVLQHGMGSWGVHRGNVAVLGPAGAVDHVLDFAVSSKLACWGVLTVAGRDDSFVVAGGYQEL